MKFSSVSFCLFVFLIGQLSLSAQNRKVLLFGIDGCRSDALQQASTPTLDEVLDSSLHTLDSWHVGLTWSGPSWSTILTGVHWPKHGVTDNSFSGSNFNQYPPFPTLAKEIDPNLKCVQVVEWGPLNDDINNHGWDKRVKVSDGDSEATADSAVIQVSDPDIDALFVYFDQVDLTGHASTFTPQNPLYINAIEDVDDAVGRILTALYARPDYASEDWLVLFITDHGGISFFHGGNSFEERHIWWAAMGDAVDKQLINNADPGTYNCGNNEVYDTTCVDLTLLKSSPVQADIAVTALHHLIYDSGVNPETKTEWELDGKSWLKESPTVGFEENTLFSAIYPNPTTGLVFLETGYNYSSTSIEVYDLLGRAIDFQTRASGSRIQLNLSGIPKGTYIVKIQTADKVATAKVILNGL